MLPFEVTSVLLLVAMVGVMVVIKRAAEAAPLPEGEEEPEASSGEEGEESRVPASVSGA
jgi:hypothetical protein